MPNIRLLTCLVLMAGSVATFTTRADEVVAVRDGDIIITEAEMEAMVDAWTGDMKRAAARDTGERFELLTSAVMSRKMAREAEALTQDDPGYWEMQFKILNIKQRQIFDRYIKSLELPDVSALAQERYETEKDKYAKVPEHRKASHILLRCKPGECNRDERRVEAEEILAQLRSGGEFEALVAEHSEDPGSKKRQGELTSWIRMGDPKVIPEFVGGLFEIEEVGEYSEVTDTTFGLHIIRMDEVAPSFYRPFDEVRDMIVRDIENEYKQLAGKEFRSGYLISDDAYINGDVMDRLFEPYLAEGEKAAEGAPVNREELDVSPDALGGDSKEAMN